MTHLQVAIGIIVDGGRLLVTRRRQGSHLPGKWEFPGGKIHPGESAAACLHRELAEELGVTVAVLASMEQMSYDYDGVRVTLHPFVVKITGGTPAALAADELRWISLEQADRLDFPPANAPLLRQLQPVLRSLALV